jgi:hypothetical protein
MSVMSSEKYMELVFLGKNSIGPGAVQSAKNTIWVIFCKKQRWTLCFCLLCRFRFGTISKTCLTWGSWRYCTVSVFYICTWENGRPLQITFYYLRICQTNCLTCATCDLSNMEGISLISLIWTKLKSILGFDVLRYWWLLKMKVHWLWCVLVGFDVVLCYFLLILVKILMHFLCSFFLRF